MKYSEKMVEHYYKELLSVRMAEEKLVEIYAQGRVPGHIHVLKHYIGLQSEYLKLDVVDKVVRLLTVITMTVVLLGLLTLTR